MFLLSFRETKPQLELHTHHRQNETLLQKQPVCLWFVLLLRCKCTPSQWSSTWQRRSRWLSRTSVTPSPPGQSLRRQASLEIQYQQTAVNFTHTVLKWCFLELLSVINILPAAGIAWCISSFEYQNIKISISFTNLYTAIIFVLLVIAFIIIFFYFVVFQYWYRYWHRA